MAEKINISERCISQKQLMLATGISRDSIQTWHKRGLLGFTMAGSGRGNRRKYSLMELAKMVRMSERSNIQAKMLEIVSVAGQPENQGGVVK